MTAIIATANESLGMTQVANKPTQFSFHTFLDHLRRPE